MDTLLQVEQLAVFFKQENSRQVAVDHISFSLTKGSFTALVGESGSGKTLTAYALLQLLPKQAHTTGRLIYHAPFGTIDLMQASEQQWRGIRGNKIALMFQEPMSALNPLMRCGHQVAECLQTHTTLSKSAIKKKVLELFDKVELPDPKSIYDQYPHQISGGQKQRVLLAMAISNQPELLIADEPTTALDIGLQHSMLQLLQKLQQELQLTVLMISHDLSLVARYAEQIMVMFRGQLVEKGRVADVMHQPQHPYTQALLQCRVQPQWKGKQLPVLVDGIMRLPDEEVSFLPEINTDAGQPDTIISCQNLTLRYPAEKNFWGKTTRYVTALNEVSFDVYKGETLGIIGESGSGKSTLARLLLQMMKPDSGRILFSGQPAEQPIKNNNHDFDIQLIFQDPYGSLNPRMQIGEAIAETIRVHQQIRTGKAKDMAMEWLEQVGLSANMYQRYPHQFSGGQRQRIGIARALANHPHILVFDESLSALDVSVQAQMLNLINRLKQQFQFTAIFISHDLNTVHYISDRVLVMKSGEIVEQGAAADIFHHPQHTYTRHLVSLLSDNKANGN